MYTHKHVSLLPPLHTHSVTLILVASSDAPTDTHHCHLLDLIFNAMVLLVGLHELETVSNVERLKTDLRVRHCCYSDDCYGDGCYGDGRCGDGCYGDSCCGTMDCSR